MRIVTKTTYYSEPDGKAFTNSDECIAWERRNNPIYHRYEFSYVHDGKSWIGWSHGKTRKQAIHHHNLWNGIDLNQVENLKVKCVGTYNDDPDPFSHYKLLEKAFKNPEWARAKLEAYDWSWLEETAEADKADCLRVIEEKRMIDMDTLVRDLFFDILEH